MPELTVNINKIINAPLETVYEAWLKPQILSKFILPMPGMSAPEIQNEAKEGGDFTIIMSVGDEKIPHTGKYLIIDRYKEIVFTWQSPFTPDNSTVTLLFSKINRTQTNIQLTHIKFFNEEGRCNHQGGWGNILDMLNQVLAVELV